VEEGTEVDVYFRNGRKNGRKNHPLLTQLEAFGLWKNRTDFKDGFGLRESVPPLPQKIAVGLFDNLPSPTDWIGSTR
jgi:hypothetical protein